MHSVPDTNTSYEKNRVTTTEVWKGETEMCSLNSGEVLTNSSDVQGTVCDPHATRKGL